jgi:hypothetical protein
MSVRANSFATTAFVVSFVFWLPGCGGGDEATETASDDAGASTTTAAADSPKAGDSTKPKKHYAPVQLGSGPGTAGVNGDATNAKPKPHNINDVISALKPLQIVMGKWEGVFKNGGVGETHDWVWDLQTDKKYPALAVSAPDGKFFTHARITYDPASSKFRMETVDKENVVRKFEGGWEAEPAEVPADDGKSFYRTFKLKLTEIANEDLSHRWEYVLSQQNNNRYQLYASRATSSSSRFTLRDVLGSQRSGTSFAQSDDDFGERTCIISQGLGTISVSYQGKSYYVCCTGCKAAFEDDPEMWIARFEEMKAEKKK